MAITQNGRHGLIYFYTILICCSTLMAAGPNETLQADFIELFEQPPGPNEPERRSQFDIKLKPITLPPIVKELVNLVPFKSVFDNFNNHHMEAVEKIKAVLQSFKDKKEALKMALALRDKSGINLRLWFTAFVGFSYLDDVLMKLFKPEPFTVMPDCFIPWLIIETGYGYGGEGGGGYGGEGGGGYGGGGYGGEGGGGYEGDGYGGGGGKKPEKPRPNDQKCAVIDGKLTSDNGPESVLWYFREDIWVNTHHWYYHIAYPLTDPVPRGDRRGELFYYMHHEVIARYNAECLTNGFPLVTPFELTKNAIIKEGYKTHLKDVMSGEDWTDRRPNRPFVDALQKNKGIGLDVKVDDTIKFSNLILKHIEEGQVIGRNGRPLPLNNVNGIDILGNIIESNRHSLNPERYDRIGVHAHGHIISAVAEDPNFEKRLPIGVMGNTATAMRDPFFYRWHGWVAEIFSKHKSKLAPYEPKAGGDYPLLFSGVKLSKVKIITTKNNKVNELTTFWTMRNVSFNRGIDFVGKEVREVRVCVKHLDHEPFTYNFEITGQPVPKATVRIFMAPRFNEKGVRFTMSEQYKLFFAMDAITLSNLKGKHSLKHQSINSKVTIPFQEQYSKVMNAKMELPFCGCGWPHHMLVPKGSTKGTVFDVFMMVSDGRDDDPNEQLETSFKANCVSAPIMCGAPKQMYPLKRPMGYPFDRLPYSVAGKVVADLDEYVKGIPNMATFQVTIKHID